MINRHASRRPLFTAKLVEALGPLRPARYAPDRLSNYNRAGVSSTLKRWAGDLDGGAAFCAIDRERIKRLLKSLTIIDLRNIYRPDDMRKRGFAYTGVGRS